MPFNDKSIKIIKRKQRESFAKLQARPEPQLKTESQSQRDILKIVTSWIEERRDAKEELAWALSLWRRNASSDT